MTPGTEQPGHRLTTDTFYSDRPGASAPTASPDEVDAPSRAKGVQEHEAGLRTKLILWLVKRRLGRVPLPARLRAHDPKLLQLADRMSRHTAAAGTVSTKLKELVQLKVAAMVGCPF
jgi:hypothetical protein